MLGRRRHKKKTRPQYWVLGSETNSRAFSHGWEDLLFVSDLKTRYCGRVFFLWRLLFLVTDPKFHSPSILSSDNSRSKTPRPKNYHIFGKLWTWGFTWWYPGYVFQYQNLKLFAEEQKFSVFDNFEWYSAKKIQKILNRTILTLDALPIAHFEAYAPFF